MKILTPGLAAALALVCAPATAQTISSLPLKGADAATYQEAGATDTGGRFYPGHVVFGWTGSALKAASVDATTGDLKVICDSGCSGAGGSGGAVTQSGTWTVNLSTLNGAALDTSVQQVRAALAAGLNVTVVGGTFWQATQPISAAALPLPTGASTSAGQATEAALLTTLTTNTAGLALHSDALAIIAALGTPLQAGGAVTVSNLPATQPVSAAALPLPAGAATAAKQDALLTALGTPLQTGGSVTVTGGPTAAGQTTANGSLTSIVANTAAPASLATGQGSATTTAAQLVAARTGRRTVTIENESTTPVRLGGSGVTTSTGFLLPGVAGASLTITYAGALYAVTPSGTAAVSFYETF